MSETQTFDIYFILEGKDYAFRSWGAVPRVGERVMFHLITGPTTFRVLDVLWGVAPDDRRTMTVNVRLGRDKASDPAAGDE
ncbi:hypothetical protein [Mesorhizobium sp. B2-1-2]|uniref:hypothetical protein n=1 Tax=Mesorhizobium sp. B2-1-2 TaxID=2589973 RepID=UPI001125D2E2|nr:hypothetical protein [Mesorhizobium sp. B2-1-2]TPN04555.1 hypothetical protein FJ971_29885 [Mesorhizobium sp. B2-1-2]